MPVLRLTVIGAAEAGKTSLVSAYVNNFCPTVYMANEAPSLYYKTVEIPVSDPSKEQAKYPVPLVVEIEDTLPWAHPELPAKEHLYFKSNWRCKHKPETGNKPACRQWNFASNDKCQAASCKFQHHAHSKQGLLHEDLVIEPFRHSDGPSVASHVEPVTKSRMGFLVVFDTNSEGSLRAAAEAVKMLYKAFPSEKPIMYLVETKMDIADSSKRGDGYKQELENLASDFLQNDGILPCFKHVTICAFELQKVRRLFRRILTEVYELEMKELEKKKPQGAAEALGAAMANTIAAGVNIGEAIRGSSQGSKKTSSKGSVAGGSNSGKKVRIDADKGMQQQCDKADCSMQ